jgi:hypothetical protein
MTFTPHQILLGDQIKKNAMGRECSTYGRRVHAGFWLGDLREKDHLKDLGTDGRIKLNCIFK